VGARRARHFCSVSPDNQPAKYVDIGVFVGPVPKQGVRLDVAH
jgi:hypothetical protein